MVGSPESCDSSTRPSNSIMRIQQSEATSHHPQGGRQARSSSSQQATFLDHTRPLLVSPPKTLPYQCICCEVLREITHTDEEGRCVTKLEIHGRLGIISHAILEIKEYRINMLPSPSKFHMLDFCNKSMESIKKYLHQYCNDHKMAGLVLMQDPLSCFYQALCVGIVDEECQ